MNEDTGTVVRLPDGTYVTAHDQPQTWWEQNQGTGYIHPNQLAPDLGQPRRTMSKHLLIELGTAIGASGVREPITVTLRSLAPWINVAPEHVDRPFAIVSGHRRQLCAMRCGLRAVPIRVRIYPNETAHRDDAALLNGQREDMSPMDIARDVRRRLDLGEKAVDIAASYGKNNINWVHDRNGLNYLAPELQAMLDPDLPRAQQLQLVVAIKLGTIRKPSVEAITAFCDEQDLDLPKEFGENEEERGHTLQLLLFRSIKNRKLIAQTAIELVENTRRKGNAGARKERTDKYRPGKRTEILANYLKAIAHGVPTTWNGAEFTRIFGASTRKDVEDFLEQARQAASTLAELIGHIEDVHRGKPLPNARTEALLNAPVAPAAKFTPTPVRTMNDMPPEEVAAILARMNPGKKVG